MSHIHTLTKNRKHKTLVATQWSDRIDYCVRETLDSLET